MSRIRLILDALDRAVRPEDIDIPGLRFHPLKGDREGAFSVWASGNWRITFGWEERGAINVDLEDCY